MCLLAFRDWVWNPGFLQDAMRGVYSTSSVCPVGTGPQAGPRTFESHIDVSAEEKRKAPVETARKTPPDIIEHVVGRIDEGIKVADLK